MTTRHIHHTSPYLGIYSHFLTLSIAEITRLMPQVLVSVGKDQSLQKKRGGSVTTENHSRQAVLLLRGLPPVLILDFSLEYRLTLLLARKGAGGIISEEKRGEKVPEGLFFKQFAKSIKIQFIRHLWFPACYPPLCFLYLSVITQPSRSLRRGGLAHFGQVSRTDRPGLISITSLFNWPLK